MIIVKHCLILIIAFLLVSCSKASDKNDAKQQEKSIAKNAYATKFHPPPLPTDMKPVKEVLQHTIFVGTPDHPTIDGGIINAADGIPVSHDVPISINITQTNLLKNKQATTGNTIVPQSPINKPFQDNWATSEKVKMLLEEAARNGKLSYVLKKTDEMGLPASVATVPMIESHYQVNAISPKGAAGAWQLMPTVAGDYGIKKEQRFQFETSTNTALALLNSLHRQFGSWELAFAAYNAGAIRVQSALRKNPQATSIEQLDLPKETTEYVKHIMRLNKVLISYKSVNEG